MTKKIPTPIAILIILILAVAVGIGAWWYSEKNQTEDLVLNQPIQKSDKIPSGVGGQKIIQNKKERTIILEIENPAKISIQSDGTWMTEGGTKGKISLSKIEKLENLIDSTDFEAMKEKKFTDICPTAYDGSESIFTFYTLNGEVKISSCETEIDNNAPLFKETNIILEDIRKTILNTDFNIIR